VPLDQVLERPLVDRTVAERRYQRHNRAVEHRVPPFGRYPNVSNR
jgi:hypothetical protein